MTRNLTGNLLGGPVAADLQRAMQVAVNTTSSPSLQVTVGGGLKA